MIFKIYRIIDCRIVSIEGIGSVMMFYDFKYGRMWARRWK